MIDYELMLADLADAPPLGAGCYYDAGSRSYCAVGWLMRAAGYDLQRRSVTAPACVVAAAARYGQFPGLMTEVNDFAAPGNAPDKRRNMAVRAYIQKLRNEAHTREFGTPDSPPNRTVVGAGVSGERRDGCPATARFEEVG
jgi:hypothetical protein